MESVSQTASSKHVAAELDHTVNRFRQVLREATREWGSEDKRWQAAEKMFLAWRLAIEALTLLTISLLCSSSQALGRFVDDINSAAGGEKAVEILAGGEVRVRVTTRNAPRVLRVLATSRYVPSEVRRVASVLRAVRDAAYRMHYYFYEGDPGAAGVEDEDELLKLSRRLLEALAYTAREIEEGLGHAYRLEGLRRGELQPS